MIQNTRTAELYGALPSYSVEGGGSSGSMALPGPPTHYPATTLFPDLKLWKPGFGLTELTVPRKIWLELSEEVPEDLGARSMPSCAHLDLAHRSPRKFQMDNQTALGSRRARSLDITPIENSNLDRNHTEIVDLIWRITRTVPTPSTLKLAFPAKDSFAINWKGFYDDLHHRLLRDAFRRWLKWAFEISPTPHSPNELDVEIEQVPNQDLKRRAVELHPDSDDEDQEVPIPSLC
ncbi:hypothetical protein DFH09DRAFT_1099543 [Mycena vulgaris]|nr:hypothetical protein DFH09DRAFT_1099543 [Mycena vulgaris]